jgi:hypothetical protein
MALTNTQKTEKAVKARITNAIAEAVENAVAIDEATIAITVEVEGIQRVIVMTAVMKKATAEAETIVAEMIEAAAEKKAETEAKTAEAEAKKAKKLAEVAKKKAEKAEK